MKYRIAAQSWSKRVMWIILVCLLTVFSSYYFLIKWPLTKIRWSHRHFTYLSTEALRGLSQQLAIQSGLHRVSSNFTTSAVTVTAMGNFSQVFHFFQRLIQLPYFLRLSQWQLTSIPAHQLQLTLIIEVYHYQ